MVKKISFLVISVLFASSTYAANSGPYVGAAIGRDTGLFKNDENQIGASQDIKYLASLAGYSWGLHMGNDFFLSRQAVVGAQIFFDHSTAEYTASGNNVQNQRSFRKKDSWGLVALPGWQLNDTNRLYARLGWLQTQFSHTTSFAAPYGPSFNNVKRNGIEWGAGYQVNIAKQWTANVDYIHSDYRAITQTSNEGNYTYKPSFNEYTVGVNYYFQDFTASNNVGPQLDTNGWYAGGALGMMNTRFSQEFTFPQDSSLNYEYKYGMRGELLNAHGGYRWQFGDSYVIGVEGFAQSNNTKMRYQQPMQANSDYTLRETRSFGVSILPGYKINNSNLVYARLGSIYSKFTKDTTYLGPVFSETQTGLQVGAGYEVAIAEHISVFGEYDHAHYAKITTPDPSVEGTYTYKPSDDQYKLGINYSF